MKMVECGYKMTKFYYYQGDWLNGKTLVKIIQAETITQADKIFLEETGIDIVKDIKISVTLAQFSAIS